MTSGTLDEDAFLILSDTLEADRKGHWLKFSLCVFSFLGIMVLITLAGVVLIDPIVRVDIVSRFVATAEQGEVARTYAEKVMPALVSMAGACLVFLFAVHDCIRWTDGALRAARIRNEKLLNRTLPRAQCSNNNGSIKDLILGIFGA